MSNFKRIFRVGMLEGVVEKDLKPLIIEESGGWWRRSCQRIQFVYYMRLGEC